MSHVVIIIQRNAPITANHDVPECTYHYQIPVPHNATPAEVGELVRKAYRRLESADPSDH